MDYQDIYDKIILNAQYKNRTKKDGIVYENHHIIPKCVGGIDARHNTVLLTPKEHFICHKLLCFIYNSDKLKFAFWACVIN